MSGVGPVPLDKPSTGAVAKDVLLAMLSSTTKLATTTSATLSRVPLNRFACIWRLSERSGCRTDMMRSWWGLVPQYAPKTALLCPLSPAGPRAADKLVSALFLGWTVCESARCLVREAAFGQLVRESAPPYHLQQA